MIKWKNAILPLIFVITAICLSQESIVRPNIIFIMVDDLGKEWISSYGADEVVTPNIDAMVKNGLKFNNACSMPKCTPTRTSLLTGLYPCNSGWVNHWDVPRWSLPKSKGGKGGAAHFDWKYNMTFARVMKSAGYVTAAAGKWQVNDFRVHPDAMVDHGFDEYAMWTGFETGNSPSAERYWDAYIHSNGVSKTYKNKFGTDVFLDFIIDFMGRHVDKPQMIYFPMALTHGPLTTTPHNLTASTNKEKHIAMVEYTDYAVGRIINAADSLGIDSNTIIIFTTDNGTSTKITGTLDGKTVQGGKGTLGENGVCEPFIVLAPGLVPAGAETGLLTDFTDMFPTFAELGGVNMDTLYHYYPIDGHSIARTLLGQTPDFEREWIMAMGGGVAALTDTGIIPAKAYAKRVVRDKQYKAWVDNAGKITKIYNLSADPGEKNNLIGSNAPEVLAALVKFNGIVNSFPSVDSRPVYDSAVFAVPPELVKDLPETATHMKFTGVEKEPQNIAFSFKNGILQFYLKNAANISFQINNMLGKNVHITPAKFFTEGFNRISITDMNLANGIYVTQITLDDIIHRQRIFIMR